MHSSPTHRGLARWQSVVQPALSLVVFGAVLYAVDRLLREYHWREITQALQGVPLVYRLSALLVAATGYLALVGCDCIAFRYVGRPLPLREMLIPSFITFAVSNSAPASVITAGGLRYRLYQSHGLSAADATAVAAFNVVTYVLGLFVVSGVGLLIQPPAAPIFRISGRLLGVLLLSLSAAYLTAARLRARPIKLLRWTIPLPAFKQACAQLGLSVADWMLSGAALYILLEGSTSVSFLAFFVPFLAGQFTALVAPLPGGIGVFEAVMLLLRPSGASVPAVLAALLLYRVIYYLLPLLAAGLLGAGLAIRRARSSGQTVHDLSTRILALTPRALAYTTFLAGALLLLTGAIPSNDRRVAWLNQLLPLGLIEASHFLSSVVGAVLIILAWGLELRNRRAYQLVRILFGAGILLTLLRSYDMRLAAFLLLCLTVLLLAGHAFPRPAPLAVEKLGPYWIVAIGAILLLELWTAILVYSHSELKGEIWWRFALFGHGPRTLRAAVGASVVILMFGLARLLHQGSSGLPGGPHDT